MFYLCNQFDLLWCNLPRILFFLLQGGAKSDTIRIERMCANEPDLYNTL
nr:MAG TPA: hypothetical protein [Caudoviricetes sp.]